MVYEIAQARRPENSLEQERLIAEIDPQEARND
jgi:hypothetical protein